MLAFMCLLFIMLGIVFIVFSSGETGSVGFWLKVIGVLVIAIFALCLIYYVKVLMEKKPALIVSEEGIFDQSSYIGAGLVRWEEIEAIDFVQFSGQVFLGITTYDPELIINRTSGVKKWLNKANRGLVSAQVNIPVKILACPLDDLVDEINERWEEASHDPHIERNEEM
ncbi:hypothetical protein KHA95_18395 [Bacillus sp. FJAT-50079]|nr:hypothetical protein [Bacillus sp. FJAT-50079]